MYELFEGVYVWCPEPEPEEPENLAPTDVEVFVGEDGDECPF